MKLRAVQERAPLSIFFFRNPRAIYGFTLVELITVVAVISLLVSLAIPPLLRARVQSNESATMGNLRTISSAAEAFRTTQNPPAYPANLNSMITSNPPYLDSSWSNSQRQGYNYVYVTAGDGTTYSVAASPQIVNISGVNSYCVDQTGVIRRYAQGQGGTVGDQDGCNASGAPI